MGGVQTAAGEARGFQFSGSNSPRRVIESAGIRESTSRNQATAPTRHLFLQEAIKLRNTANVSPPASLPKNVQFPRPKATSRLAPFRGAVVDLQLSDFQKARQRLPLIQRIAHRCAGWTLRQNLRLPF